MHNTLANFPALTFSLVAAVRHAERNKYIVTSNSLTLVKKRSRARILLESWFYSGFKNESSFIARLLNPALNQDSLNPAFIPGINPGESGI